MNPTNLTPLVFLDIDDVLCMSDPVGGYDALDVVNERHPNPRAVFRDLFDPRACRALAEVHEAMNANLRYVISSTWREAFDRAQMDRVFRGTGLAFVADSLHDELRWRTPEKFGKSRRVDEISQWLKLHHQGEPFVIIDDSYSGPSLRPALTRRSHPFTGRVVLCRENEGLLPEHVPTIVDALRRDFPTKVVGDDK